MTQIIKIKAYNGTMGMTCIFCQLVMHTSDSISQGLFRFIRGMHRFRFLFVIHVYEYMSSVFNSDSKQM